MEERITLHLGDALETLAELPESPVDFALIDADKTGYDAYYDAVLPRLRPGGGGLIAFDNMLWGVDVIDSAEEPADDASDIRAIRERFMNHAFPLTGRGFMLWRWISNFTRRLRRVVGGFGVRRSSGRR